MKNFHSINIEKLTSGRLIVNNTILNFIGQIAPLLVALFTLPVILSRIGIDRFGILNLAWMAIGYFSLFDFGLGRALTKIVAEKLGQRKEHELPSLIWSASGIMILIGIFSSLLMVLISAWAVAILKVPAELRDETVKTFYLLSLSVPVITSTAGLRGVLEAFQRFDLTTSLRIPIGIMTFLSPVLMLPFTRSVFWITSALVIVRILAWFAHISLCLKVLPSLKTPLRPNKELVKELISFGGWMTVSNIISPMMVSADRFIIGALISTSAVSYYSTPWEVVTKFLLIPASIIGVLFPAFTTSFSLDPQRASGLYSRALKYIITVLLPITVLAVFFAKSGLTIWLGREFADNSYRVMQILMIGVFFNGLGYLPFGLIQGVGRPDITAKLHFIEVLFYLPCIFLLIKYNGIAGAAFAWSSRAAVDVLLLYLITRKIFAKYKTARFAHPDPVCLK